MHIYTAYSNNFRSIQKKDQTQNDTKFEFICPTFSYKAAQSFMN